jgi:Kdo2-lipid IVA lauroyltransferase/acyltransferase
MMQALLFYLLYPLIYLVASLPFSLLYIFSDFLYHVLRLSGYRKEVVLKNLRNSFPEKSQTEIDIAYKAYYHYLCDLVLETLKTMTMTEKEVAERCIFNSTRWLDKYFEEKKNILIVMGHYGNWEWAGPAFILKMGIPLSVIYRPLSNPYFEKMTSKMRTRFGTRIIPVNNTLREMVAGRGKLTVTAFIADQTAGPENSHWTNFLNQDTPVHTGPEKLAKKFNYPVVYMSVRRVRRGYYDITPELLFDQPGKTADGEISEAFIKRLERDIIKDPAIWLWSHRRWKYVRKKIENSGA